MKISIQPSLAVGPPEGPPVPGFDWILIIVVSSVAALKKRRK